MSLPNYFVSSLNQTLSVGGNDTSIQLSTIYTQDGQVVTTADFAAYGRGIITVNPLTVASCEFISFTGITANTAPLGTLTGCLRGLSFKGNNQIAANQKFNVVGTPVIISFGTHNLLDIPTLAANQTFAGLITFTQPPIGINPGGSPNASNTVAGITKLSVAPVSGTNPIALGQNDPVVPTSGEALALVGNNTDVAVGSGNTYVTQTGSIHNAEKYAVDTGTADVYAVALSPIPTSLTDGMVVYAKIVHANATTTPTLNVNSLGAKTIVKLGGTAMVANDIVANQLCTFIYDLSNTRWILQNATPITLYQEYVFTTTGTWVCPRGVTSVLADIQAGGGSGGGGASGSSGGGGGGGGGQALSNQTSTVIPLTTYTVTVGTGGTGVASNSNGNAGNTSTFNGTSATGGNGGSSGSGTNGGAGGSHGDATAGNGGAGGSAGGAGVNGGTGTGGGSGGTGGSAAGNSGGGGGGASGFGVTGGNGGTFTGSVVPTAGVFGGGGGGSYGNGGTSGAGGNGIIIIKVPLNQII